jgi:hypothetical protein
MPSVTDINIKMKEWCRDYKWQYKPSITADRGEGVFNDLWKIVKQYYNEHFWRVPKIDVDFEKILGEMIALASWVTPSPFGNAFRQAVRDSRLSQHFTWSLEPDGPYLHQIIILEEFGHLLKQLAIHMRELSKNFKKQTGEFQKYHNILYKIRQEFDVGIYNLNYDNVAISAWPDAFTGFRDGEFDPRSVVLRTEWGFIYHLHGSVHHSLDPCATRIVWKDDLNSTEFKDSEPLKQRMVEGFKPIMPTTLIAGGFKLDQLLIDPFQTFYASLVRHVHEADAILIAGYGFGDVHVNSALENRCSLFDQSRRPRIIILEKTKLSGAPIGCREDEWKAIQLKRALSTSFGISNQTIEQMMRENYFEYDLQNRVAIWHGGFIEAADCLDAVIDWLR